MLLGVGLVAGSTLALQVLLTRVFATVLLYHFGFLAISLALLGTGAGAVAITFGFKATTLVAFACYALALGDVVLGRWPGTAEAEQRPPVAGLEPART